MATNETIWQFRHARQNGAAVVNAAAQDFSMWEYEGKPSHGAVPSTTYANPGRATAGGLLQADPAGGKQKWLTSLMLSGGANQGVYALQDRLLTKSGLDGTSAGAQNINGGSPATLSRHDADPLGNLDVGNELWLEIYSQVGATPTTVTCSYKNQAGVTHSTRAVVFGGAGNMEAQRFVRLPLAAGDTGVQSAISVTLAGSTGAVGNFGVVVTHRLLNFAMGLVQPEIYVGAVEGDIEIMTDACLMWSYMLCLAPVVDVPHFFACFTFADR